MSDPWNEKDGCRFDAFLLGTLETFLKANSSRLLLSRYKGQISGRDSLPHPRQHRGLLDFLGFSSNSAIGGHLTRRCNYPVFFNPGLARKARKIRFISGKSKREVFPVYQIIADRVPPAYASHTR